MFSTYSHRSVTLMGVVKYQPGNAPRMLALELTSMFRYHKGNDDVSQKQLEIYTW